ncbi:hypothetical protein B9Z55_021565 [Caenorhabditis nigoni]|nr:hypothetical protein B9Z55_021565 [Caenorhabditis nigoni]
MEIFSKKLWGKSNNWDNLDCLVFVASLFGFSPGVENVFLLIDYIRNVKVNDNADSIFFLLLVFQYYNLIMVFATIILICTITQRFLKLWSIFAIFNIFIGFAFLVNLYRAFTTDPHTEIYIDAFKYMLISMPIWFSMYVFANGFGAVVLWRISNMKRGYYGDDIYLVIYGGEESSTKKMEISNL